MEIQSNGTKKLYVLIFSKPKDVDSFSRLIQSLKKCLSGAPETKKKKQKLCNDSLKCENRTDWFLGTSGCRLFKLNSVSPAVE